jgi:Domain of unknown function (DUF222)
LLVSALRSGIQELVDEDLALVDDMSLEGDVSEISRVIGLLEAQKLRRVAEVDRRRTYTRDGGVSITAWLARTCEIGSGTAGREVGVARRLASMPLTWEAFSAGDISLAKVGILSSACEAHPERFGSDESLLVGLSPQLTVGEFRRAVSYWRNLQDEDRANLEVMEMRERSFLHISRTWAGMVRLDGQLDPESGEIVLEAIAAVTSEADRAADSTARAGGTVETAAQRRAHALVDLCRRSLDAGSTVVGGVRPHVKVTVDYETLARRVGTTCELSKTGTITPETARRLACDAGVSRVIVGPDSEPLDVGRTHRMFTPAQRRALTIRDKGCRFPHCDRPPDWCDGHHVTHWVDGGETSLANAVLLCRRHHVLVHEGAYHIDPDHTFHRPDGTPIDDG